MFLSAEKKNPKQKSNKDFPVNVAFKNCYYEGKTHVSSPSSRRL